MFFQTREEFISDNFHEDGRAQLAFDWLDGTRPQGLMCARDPDQAEQEYEQVKQAKVTRFAFRTIASSVGRSAMFLGRLTTFPDLPVSVQALTLSVKVQPSTLTACPDITAFGPDVMHWPEFHNGVAHATELPLDSRKLVTRGWILQHHGLVEQARSRRNPHESPELMIDRLGGFIFGLGLLKQLNALRADDIYRFLRINSEVVTISTLLGLAISGHPKASKLTLLHVLPPDSDLEISGVVQAAGLLGVGFAGLQSNDRLTAELVLGLIGKRPIAGDRIIVNESETFNLAAGISLGLLTLGRATEMADDLHLKTRLFSLLGTVDVGSNQVSLPPLAASQMHQRQLGDPATRSNLVLEGSKPNITLSAPAASLALGFGWWKTNDIAVLKSLDAPQTFTELEKSPRPEALFFRRLAYWLVAWDSLDATNWAETPQFMCSHDTDYLLIAQTVAYLQAAGALVLAVKFAGTNNADVKNALWLHAKSLIIDGAYFPSSQLSRMSSKAPSDVSIDRHTFDSCRVTAAFALSIVCAGSGDLDVLRLLRCLRNGADDSTTYGTHQAVSQAVGFLFLGGGKKTFDNSAERLDKLACLLISVLPRYPASSTDQRFSLQACRHLFVLAAKDRAGEVDKENGVNLLTANVNDIIEQFGELLVKNRLN